jgi:hypothetical protein
VLFRREVKKQIAMEKIYSVSEGCALVAFSFGEGRDEAKKSPADAGLLITFRNV